MRLPETMLIHLWSNIYVNRLQCVNTLRPRQDDRHFSDDVFECSFLNENVSISINISPKFVPESQVNDIPALVQIMAWRRPGDKPLSEPMMFRLPTHLYITRPQCVKDVFALGLLYMDIFQMDIRKTNRSTSIIVGWSTGLYTEIEISFWRHFSYWLRCTQPPANIKALCHGPLWGEFTGERWIPRTKASDAELWYFLWSSSE